MKVPSISYANHRYRGPMESEKHILTLHQAIHDIRELYHSIAGDEDEGIQGIKNYIDNNMKRLVQWRRLAPGEADSVYADLDPNTTLNSQYAMQALPLENIPPTAEQAEILGLKGKLHSLRQQAINAFDQV